MGTVIDEHKTSRRKAGNTGFVRFSMLLMRAVRLHGLRRWYKRYDNDDYMIIA